MSTSRRSFLKAASIAMGTAALSGEMAALAGASHNNDPNPNPKVIPVNSNRQQKSSLLWYTAPAAGWLEALPIGNGRISAMVYGGTEKEELQLNEGTLWAGSPHDYTSPEGLAALPEVRRLVFAGKWQEAQQLADAKMLGRPASQMPYQTAGSLHLENTLPGAVADYHRQLDLDTAITTTRYRSGDIHFQREAFASAPHNVIVVHLTADRPGSIGFKLRFDSPQKSHSHVGSEGRELTLDGQNGDSNGVPGLLKYCATCRVHTAGGRVTSGSDGMLIEVEGADSVTLTIALATSYKGYRDISADPAERVVAILKAVEGETYDKIKHDHTADYQRLYHRVTLNVGSADSENLPTNERVALFQKGHDPQLAALHFQYGRYLLISCSRSGGQPATLQGLWNDSVSPPWGSKYTININTEMNYWPAGPANLQECYEPLFEMLKELAVAGRKTAKELYGARGWVCHHNTDGWRGTSPVDASYYGLWPMGGAWLCKNLWDHYEYTHDLAALKEHYPILRDAALFFLDALVEDPEHGWLVTCPSVSPEHGHHGGVSICAGPTMDNQILNDLFSACIQASELLQTDADLRDQWKHTQTRLPPMQVGSAGQLQEWMQDWDMQAEDIHHRHVSHLYGLYPSDQITKRRTEKLFAAAKRSLEIRGDMATGWSLAWKINLWARLEEGDRAYKLLGDLLTPERTAPNLFDLHPPFQIDGNFGASAGILEMLIQSRNGEIHLLPALPSAWSSGELKGAAAKGGFILDLTWTDGKLKAAHIVSRAGAKCNLRLGEKTVTFETHRGGSYTVHQDLKIGSV